jgi:hypothetical protein
MRRCWLAERGLQDYYRAQSFRPDSQGLRCIGRWSYGPSVKVSLRVTDDDTIVCLARGSGASIIRFRSRDSLELDLLSDIDCYGIVSRAVIQDTLVFCGMSQGGTGIEVWGVSDLTEPHRLSYVYLPPIMDIAMQDTFLYATGYVQDSLRVFNVADPMNPVLVGACADSGYPMCVSGDYCYLADRGGVNIIDVSDPANPHRIGKAGAGGIAQSVAVRDTLCFFGLDNNTLQVYNVRNPASPSYVGSVSGTLPADLYLPPTCDTVLYTPRFDVINIANPASPRIIGQVGCPGWDYGVTAVPALNYALVADHFEGLVAVDISQPTAPGIDTSLFAADLAEDVAIDNRRAYVASYHSGLRILDVSDPTSPRYLGCYDTVGTRPRMNSAVARDSFAYVGWYSVPSFVSLDITDPAHPRRAGGAMITNPPEDMVLRDSLVYVAMWGGLQVVNVARPREPEMIGSCGLSGATWDLDVEDTVAYVTSTVFNIVSIAQPDNPRVIGTWNFTQAADVVDTIAYMACRYDIGLRTVNVADPTSPRVLDTLAVDGWFNDIVVIDSLAYAGGDKVRVYDIADPRDLREVGAWTPPHEVRRLAHAPPYLYAACYDGGVCVLESLQVGVSEKGGSSGAKEWLAVAPNPARGRATVKLGRDMRSWVVRDVAGRRVCSGTVGREQHTLELDLTDRPAGVYVLELRGPTGGSKGKIVRR